MGAAIAAPTKSEAGQAGVSGRKAVGGNLSPALRREFLDRIGDLSGSGIRRTYLARLTVSPRTQSPSKVPPCPGGSERIDGSERPTVQRGTKYASRGVKKGELQ